MVESGLHTSIQFMDGKGMPNHKHLWQMVSHHESDGVNESRKKEMWWLCDNTCIALDEVEQSINTAKHVLLQPPPPASHNTLQSSA